MLLAQAQRLVDEPRRFFDELVEERAGRFGLDDVARPDLVQHARARRARRPPTRRAGRARARRARLSSPLIADFNPARRDAHGLDRRRVTSRRYSWSRRIGGTAPCAASSLGRSRRRYRPAPEFDQGFRDEFTAPRRRGSTSAANSSRLAHARSGGRPPASGWKFSAAIGPSSRARARICSGVPTHELRRALQVVEGLGVDAAASSADPASGTTRRSASRRAGTARSRPTPGPGSSVTWTNVGPSGTITKPPSKPIAIGLLAVRVVQRRVGVHRHHRQPQPGGPARGRGHSPADEHRRVRLRSPGFGVTRTVRPCHSNGSPVHACSIAPTAPRGSCRDARARRRPSRTRRRGSPRRARSTAGPGTRCRSPRSARRRGSGRAAAGSSADSNTGARSVIASTHRGHRQRRRHPAVVDAVVLREHEEVEAVRVGPPHLLERGGVDVARRRGTERRAHGSPGASS